MILFLLTMTQTSVQNLVGYVKSAKFRSTCIQTEQCSFPITKNDKHREAPSPDLRKKKVASCALLLLAAFRDQWHSWILASRFAFGPRV